MTKLDLIETPNEIALAENAAVIKALGKRVVGDVIEIGSRLTACKELCGHGNWLPWLDREFGWDERTARRFMEANEFALSKSDKLSDLSIGVSSLYLLAAPSTPEAARDAVLDLAANGETLTHAQVKKMIAEAKDETAANYEDQINTLTARYEKEAQQLREDLQATAEPPIDIEKIVDDALTPLRDKIKRLEEEREKQRNLRTRPDPFGLQATRIVNALHAFVAALDISSEQLMQHQQVLADATHRSIEQTSKDMLKDARTAQKWLHHLLTENHDG